MRFRVAVGSNVLSEIRFTCIQLLLRQFATKELVTKPDAIRVHNIGFAIVGYLLYPSFMVIVLHFRSIYDFRFVGQSQHPTNFMQSGFALAAKTRQDSA